MLSCASWLPLARPISSDPPITHRYTQAPMCLPSPPGRSSAQGSSQSRVEGVSPQEPMGQEKVMPGSCNKSPWSYASMLGRPLTIPED
jgi:hypothetical protein